MTGEATNWRLAFLRISGPLHGWTQNAINNGKESIPLGLIVSM